MAQTVIDRYREIVERAAIATPDLDGLPKLIKALCGLVVDLADRIQEIEDRHEEEDDQARAAGEEAR